MSVDDDADRSDTLDTVAPTEETTVGAAGAVDDDDDDDEEVSDDETTFCVESWVISDSGLFPASWSTS